MAASSMSKERQEREEQLQAFHEELEENDGMSVGEASAFLKVHALDFAAALIHRTDLSWDGASWVFHLLTQEAVERSETITFIEMRQLQEKYGNPDEQMTVEKVREWIEAEGDDPDERLPDTEELER